MPLNSDTTGGLTALDLFAGGGGLTVGLKRAGFRVLGAVEVEPHAFSTYKVNHPEVAAFRQDIRTIEGRSLLDLSPTLGTEIQHTLLRNMFKQGDDTYKLLPTQGDRESFKRIINKEPVEDGTQIEKAYSFFARKFRKADFDVTKLKQIIEANLVLVSIVLDRDDNPHLIFESLNAKGRALSQADLIRNYFFMRVHISQQDALFNTQWKPMQDALGGDLTQCIRHFLMRDGPVVKEGDVYFTLKERADRKSAGEVLEYLSELVRFSEHIDTFQETVAIRQPNRKKQAKHQAGRVRIVCKALNAQSFTDLKADALLKYLDGRGMADATRRGYIIVMKDFAKEMVRLGVAKENPFAHLKPPGQYSNPQYERQPLTVEQFDKLMAYMETFTRYFQQKSRWTAADRRIVYWTAVKTAFRQSELRSLRKAYFHLDETPASIGLKARDAKNRTAGEVPIPRALADALKEYMADLEPNDKVFPLPESSGSIVDMMRRDLKGAGIPWKLPTGEVVDFHTLRSTAICWWLDVDKLSPKRVQTLARLKTLALVYKYSRKWRIGDHDWLDEGPSW